MTKVFRYSVVLIGMLATGAVHALQVHGQICDMQKAPLSGARVWLLQEEQVYTATSDAQGKFAIDGINVAPSVLTVYQPGFAVGGHAGVLMTDTEVPVTLSPAATVHVQAISAPGLPAPGARVRTIILPQGVAIPVERLAEAGFPKLRTDDEGRVTVEMLPRGVPVSLWFTHAQYADTEVVCVPGEEDDRQAVMLPGVALRGRVTCSGKSVVGAHVFLFQMKAETPQIYAEAWSDPEGLYHLQAGPGEYLIEVRHKDYASPASAAARMRDYATPVVADLEMAVPHIVQGQVLLPDGSPCIGAGLSFRQAESGVVETFSGSEGRFRLRTGAPSGALEVHPPLGFMMETATVFKVLFKDGDKVDLGTIRLKELPAVTGTILDTDGKPATRALITSLNKDLPFWTFPDAEGRFRIQLAAAPEDGMARFRVEHADRFQRADFALEYANLKPVEVKMKPYTPDQTQDPAKAGTNKLAGLLGKMAPALQCRAWIPDTPIGPDQLRNKVVVITFLGGFDQSLQGINRMDELRALQHLFKDDSGILFLAVHDGTSENEFVEEWVKAAAIPFPVGVDTEDLVTFSSFRINAIPQTVIIDRQGNLCYYQVDGRLLELIQTLRRKS